MWSTRARLRYRLESRGGEGVVGVASCRGELALGRAVAVMLGGQAHLATATDLGNGVDGVIGFLTDRVEDVLE